jgi:predicted oxidoreductase (fatty acid repression mutant protein)
LLSGKHYNCNWLLHEAFSEALERLFQEQYVPEIPASLVQFAEYPPGTIEIEDQLADVTIKAYIEHYNQQVDKCLKGQFGKTPQFWALYMMMVDRQQRLHYAINMNDYNLRLLTWRE